MKCECGNDKFITMVVVGDVEPDSEPYTNNVKEELREEHKNLEYRSIFINVNVCTECEKVYTYDGTFL